MAQPVLPIPSALPASRRGVRPPTPRWVEAIMLCAVMALAYGIVRAASNWTAPLLPGAEVSRSPLMLPLYAGLSTLRMTLAYVLSLVFSLAYAKVAVASRAAERVMLPLLDILQSVPILSFMPGVVLGLAALFPGRTIGLELAAIILIFTGQAWNMAFSFHQSLITIPRELTEASQVYRLGAWQRFTRLELPFGAIALIANSMMSWAGAWFVLTAAEQFTLGAKNFRLPGLGSYLVSAAEAGDGRALTLGLLTLVLVIVSLDLLLWRPLIAWSDRFKFEQSGSGAPESRVLDAVRDSALLGWIGEHALSPVTRALKTRARAAASRRSSRRASVPRTGAAQRPMWLRRAPLVALGIVLLVFAIWGAAAAVRSLLYLSLADWRLVGVSALATFGRTVIALALAAAWTIPVGVAIGTNPRLSRRAQSLVQIAASVPATAVFPVLLLALLSVPGGLNVAAIALMLLGTQWYVLFNVIAGAMAIPSDLKEAAVTYRVSGWRRWRTLILPAIFPYLVTGMITATGGAWNASILSEYVTFKSRRFSTVGLGALIARSADSANFVLLLAATLVMAAIVITINRLVWRRLYTLAETRYRLE